MSWADQRKRARSRPDREAGRLLARRGGEGERAAVSFVDGQTIWLWDGPAPGSEGWAHEEQAADATVFSPDPIVRNVVSPRLTAFLPEEPTERAVIIAPGGAFHFVSHRSSGSDVAELVRAAGTAAFVLTYRTVPTPLDDDDFVAALSAAFAAGDIDHMGGAVMALATDDGDRAIELVRAAGYSHVALVGFSAGARLTAEIILRRRPERRPDVAACIYLPSVRDPEADGDVPPLFVLAAEDDPLGITGSLELERAWRKIGRPVELHLFERGGHGFGTSVPGQPVGCWPDLLLRWLAVR
jgi:acetyl esterase/lipase